MDESNESFSPKEASIRLGEGRLIIVCSWACWLSNLLCRSNSGNSTVHARAAAVFAIWGRTAGSPPFLSPSQTLYKRYIDDRGALRFEINTWYICFSRNTFSLANIRVYTARLDHIEINSRRSNVNIRVKFVLFFFILIFVISFDRYLYLVSLV